MQRNEKGTGNYGRLCGVRQFGSTLQPCHAVRREETENSVTASDALSCLPVGWRACFNVLNLFLTLMSNDESCRLFLHQMGDFFQ
jgi:hypothetical protein